MFNLRPEDLFPWLRVEPPPADEVPGFNLNPDGSAGDTRRSAASGGLRIDSSANPSPSMDTGRQDAMPFAAGNVFPVTYLPSGLPDFAPPPRHPLQDALDEIMRIYAGFAPRPSGPFVQQGPRPTMVSPTVGQPLSRYAAESPSPEPSVPVTSAWPDKSDDLPTIGRSSGIPGNSVAPPQALESPREPDDQGSSLPWLPVNPPAQLNSTIDQDVRRTGAANAPTTEINAPPRVISIEAPEIQQTASLATPERLADINARPDSARPIAQETNWHSWSQRLKDGQTDMQTTGISPGDPWPAVVQPRQQQPPFPQEPTTRLGNVPETTFSKDPVGIEPTPLKGASPVELSVYNPDVDPGYDDLFDLIQGVRENKIQGDAARDAQAEIIKKAHPNAPFAQEIRLYAPDVPGYMTVDIMFRPNGTSMIMILEVKSGNARLSPQQAATLVEVVRTGNVYMVNEEAAKKFGLHPNETFASKRIIPEVYVSGGNQDAIKRQLNKLGIEAVPEGTRRGQVPRLRIGGPPP